MSERDAMAQCLALAALGEGTVGPNPMVGCVIVAGGEVVGSGYHRAAGERHAECLALAAAGPRARGATLYVNLEPCAHHGRTAPCSTAIVAAGIGRVVAATRDPNPLVDGRGFAALQAAGIEVAVGLLAAEARALNAPFLSSHERRRPWVTIKAAQSLDGRIAAATGSSTWVTGEASRRYAHRLRYRHDAVLVGATTVRRDDPQLTIRLPGLRAPRMRVVLAPRLAIDPAARVFLRADESVPLTRVYVDRDVAESEAARFRGIAEIVPVARAGTVLDLAAVLSDLHTAGVQSLLVEGGGKTSAAFLEQGLADGIVLFVAPRLFGSGDATPLLDLPAASDPASAMRVVSAATIPLGADTLIVGRPERA